MYCSSLFCNNASSVFVAQDNTILFCSTDHDNLLDHVFEGCGWVGAFGWTGLGDWLREVQDPDGDGSVDPVNQIVGVSDDSTSSIASKNHAKSEKGSSSVSVESSFFQPLIHAVLVSFSHDNIAPEYADQEKTDQDKVDQDKIDHDNATHEREFHSWSQVFNAHVAVFSSKSVSLFIFSSSCSNSDNSFCLISSSYNNNVHVDGEEISHFSKNVLDHSDCK